MLVKNITSHFWFPSHLLLSFITYLMHLPFLSHHLSSSLPEQRVRRSMTLIWSNWFTPPLPPNTFETTFESIVTCLSITFASVFSFTAYYTIHIYHIVLVWSTHSLILNHCRVRFLPTDRRYHHCIILDLLVTVLPAPTIEPSLGDLLWFKLFRWHQKTWTVSRLTTSRSFNRPSVSL